jgi:GntR family transcriptional regulator / MocR family aminotransferase
MRSDLLLVERTNSRVRGVLVELSRDSRTALHRQIEGSIRGAIRASRLGRCAALPSARGVAAELDVSRGVVVEAYQQLVAEGY